mmetsp:Transcript_15667/g.32076  ORF Transcript_15667/g.32076 Transcript_15667/m.32076 type:complete len:81 (-) Transcript_15667:5-247(-)
MSSKGRILGMYYWERERKKIRETKLFLNRKCQLWKGNETKSNAGMADWCHRHIGGRLNFDSQWTLVKHSSSIHRNDWSMD